MLLTQVEYFIKGITPHVQHNGQLADPSNEYAVKMKEITKKRGKTPEDYRELENYEWEGSLYLDDNLRVVVPGTSIVGALVLAAKASRDGTTVRNAVTSQGNWLLEYPGPKDLDKLKADPNYRFRTSVVVPSTRSRVMRCRPIFRVWSLRFMLAFRADKQGKETGKITGSRTTANSWGAASRSSRESRRCKAKRRRRPLDRAKPY